MWKKRKITVQVLSGKEKERERERKNQFKVLECISVHAHGMLQMSFHAVHIALFHAHSELAFFFCTFCEYIQSREIPGKLLGFNKNQLVGNDGGH